MERLPNPNKSPRIAWVGFCISLTVLILVLIVFCVIACHPKNKELPFSSLIMLLFLVGGPLGILGLILSINGVSSANRTNSKAWPGICGIIFCCASVLSVFVIPLTASVIKSHKTDIENARSQTETYDTPKNPHILLVVTDLNELKCYNKNSANDNNPATMRTYTVSFSHDFETWLQLNNVNSSTKIVISSEKNADFSAVVAVLDELKALGYTNIIVE